MYGLYTYVNFVSFALRYLWIEKAMRLVAKKTWIHALCKTIHAMRPTYIYMTVINVQMYMYTRVKNSFSVYMQI